MSIQERGKALVKHLQNYRNGRHESCNLVDKRIDVLLQYVGENRNKSTDSLRLSLTTQVVGDTCTPTNIYNTSKKRFYSHAIQMA